MANERPDCADHIRNIKYLASLCSCRAGPWELILPGNKSSFVVLFTLSSLTHSLCLNSPCIVRKVLRHVEIHGHVVAIVRVAPHPLTLHHLSSPFNHFKMQSLHFGQDALRGCIHCTCCCCCLQPECNDWEIEVTKVYDTFMMSRGVELLGHWQQRNCYSSVFSLQHSSTIRIQWGGPKYCSRPCTPDAAGLQTRNHLT